VDAADRWLAKKKKEIRKSKKKLPDGNRSYRQRDQILLHLGFESYGAYLRSKAWKRVVRLVSDRDVVCRICGVSGSVCHHFSYSLDTLKGSDITEVVLLCGGCHLSLEFNPNGRKRRFLEVRNLSIQALAQDPSRTQ